MKDPVTFSSGVGGTSIDDSPVAGLTLNQSDDPVHHRFRSLVSHGFTPNAIAQFETDLRRRASTIVDALPAGESFDFVSRVAQEPPLQAICSILGVPLEDGGQLARIVDPGIEADPGEILGSRFARELGKNGQQLKRSVQLRATTSSRSSCTPVGMTALRR